MRTVEQFGDAIAGSEGKQNSIRGGRVQGGVHGRLGELRGFDAAHHGCVLSFAT